MTRARYFFFFLFFFLFFFFFLFLILSFPLFLLQWPILDVKNLGVGTHGREAICLDRTGGVMANWLSGQHRCSESVHCSGWLVVYRGNEKLDSFDQIVS